jgi:hypothetical protein
MLTAFPGADFSSLPEPGTPRLVTPSLAGFAVSRGRE